MRIKLEGLKEATRGMRQLSDKELSTALRNAINDTARDVIKRQESEISRVFHKPTPKVQRPYFLDKATKEQLTAEIRIKDVFGKGTGRAIPNTLEPHIPGFKSSRQSKGMETRLRAKGLLGANEYLVPSRTMKLNSYGNISGALASKMLNDLWAFSEVAGFDSNTSEAKSRFIWGEIKPRGKSPIKGIWLTSRFKGRKQNALMMMVVRGAPTYGKRLRFHEIGRREVDKVFYRHLESAIDHAIRRSMR